MRRFFTKQFLAILSKLDVAAFAGADEEMEISGRVQNGVVVLDGNASLPEGAAVTVRVRSPLIIRVTENQLKVEFPLIRSNVPGSVHLNNEVFGQILDEGDAAR